MAPTRPERAYVTISVDDGHPTDLRTADLLAAFGLQATFYIPAVNPERAVLPASDIKLLAQRFEIGGHTLNHRRLTTLPHREAQREVVDGKHWLEALTGKPAIAFCYPQGKFTSAVVSIVKEAGFRGARTCLFNLNRWPADPFVWGVTTHAYSHSTMIQLRHALWEGNFRGVTNFVQVHGGARDWEEHFTRGLDHVQAMGGIAHLYLHSWEVDERNEWPKLRRVLQAISSRGDLTPISNGRLFELWHRRDVDCH